MYLCLLLWLLNCVHGCKDRLRMDELRIGGGSIHRYSFKHTYVPRREKGESKTMFSNKAYGSGLLH